MKCPRCAGFMILSWENDPSIFNRIYVTRCLNCGHREWPKGPYEKFNGQEPQSWGKAHRK